MDARSEPRPQRKMDRMVERKDAATSRTIKNGNLTMRPVEARMTSLRWNPFLEGRDAPGFCSTRNEAKKGERASRHASDKKKLAGRFVTPGFLKHYPGGGSVKKKRQNLPKKTRGKSGKGTIIFPDNRNGMERASKKGGGGISIR